MKVPILAFYMGIFAPLISAAAITETIDDETNYPEGVTAIINPNIPYAGANVEARSIPDDPTLPNPIKVVYLCTSSASRGFSPPIYPYHYISSDRPLTRTLK